MNLLITYTIYDIKLTINLEPRTQPILIEPYRMSPVELKRLNSQLQNFLDEAFIRLSLLPCGSPVLFM